MALTALVAMGAQDLYLTAPYPVSFFSTVYSKKSNFALDSMITTATVPQKKPEKCYIKKQYEGLFLVSYKMHTNCSYSYIEKIEYCIP